MLQTVAPLSAEHFAAAIIMPNLLPPVTTKEALLAYRDSINHACGRETFAPLMTLFFRPDYSRAFLEEIREDLTAIKLYPAGITTN
jgi:dihydroorotase